MGRLIRYPPIEDVTTLIRLAHEEIVRNKISCREFLSSSIAIVKGIKKQSSNARGLFKANPPDKRVANQKSQIREEDSSPDAKVILFGSGTPSINSTTKKEETITSSKVTVVKVAGDGDVFSNPLNRGAVPTKQQTPVIINKPKEG